MPGLPPATPGDASVAGDVHGRSRRRQWGCHHVQVWRNHRARGRRPRAGGPVTLELRLTVGELGFAVGVVATMRRALELLRTELGVHDDAGARAVLAASSHSLVARQLATWGDG